MSDSLNIDLVTLTRATGHLQGAKKMVELGINVTRRGCNGSIEFWEWAVVDGDRRTILTTGMTFQSEMHARQEANTAAMNVHLDRCRPLGPFVG